MTMFLAPYTAIADIDGSPLDAGFLYFGEYGKAPEIFPIEVFWDPDFTVPAAQPIRTRNGYPVRNGSPAKIYLREPMHSISVKNRNGSTIFVDVNGAGLVSTLLVRPSGATVEQTFNNIDASLAEKQQQINEKAPTEYVNEQLALKAPQSITYNKTEVDAALGQKANQATTYTKTEVDSALSAVAAGHKAYTTLALAQAAQGTLPANTIVEVTNDPTASNNGTYQWNGTTLTKSAYDPLTQAKTYSNELISSLNLKKSTDTDYIPIIGDAIDNRILGFDTSTETLSGAFPDSLASSQSAKNYKYFAQKPTIVDVNHVLSYGQSLSVGATATTILSTSQPYLNTTFNTSPRQDTDATSVIPLVEQFNNPAADGGTNRGETHCSGLANYASLSMLKAGINPQNHVIFASTGGHGGATIGSLAKGGVRYTRMMTHVTKAKDLNVGKTYKVQCMPWIQGENDAVSGGVQTPYATYKAALEALQVDVDADIKAVTAQTDDVRFITYQMSYAAATWSDVAKAQLDLAREHDKFMFATACYHLPFAGDHIHLTNIGYKWMGAYFGRAYKQYMIEGRKPDFLNPLSAYIKDNQIIVKFDVPSLPLKIDTTTLADTTNAGFRVMNGATNVPITSVSASGDTVTITLASAPSSNLQVRYALDYLGTGLSFTGGASGNLRDSTADTVEIAGQTKPLYHVCPHFELTAFLDKGI